MARFTDLHIAVVATDGVEEAEIVLPMEALKREGAWVEVLSLEDRPIQALRHIEKGATIPVDRLVQSAHAEEFEALVLPGGTVNADTLRAVPGVLQFVTAFERASKPIAAICHAPWILVSADLVRGRTLTSYHTIQDDIRNAGGNWVDREVAEDLNWVTSRKPDDIPAFNRALFALLDSCPAPVR